jgi:hypothetical protein
MVSTAQATIYLFGASSLLAGLTCLAAPALVEPSAATHPETLPFIRANGLAATAMGIYYPLAAYQNNAAFFAATVPMRLLTTAVFWAQGWPGAAAWEGLGAVATALALSLGSKAKGA